VLTLEVKLNKFTMITIVVEKRDNVNGLEVDGVEEEEGSSSVGPRG
jgi:hypothetical protein